MSANLADFVPEELRALQDISRDIPRIARDQSLMRQIEARVQEVPTYHSIRWGDARVLEGTLPESVHLVVTSPPYWTLKEYNPNESQLGAVEDYHTFLGELDRVWSRCFESLVPGGRLVCVVGDVCLSRRKNSGRHTVVPLHSAIQERCRSIGYDNLSPIIWHKIANASYEVDGAGGFLGKPYEPNAVIKNDIEFILMLRKPGGYRQPDVSSRLLSIISVDNYRQWFQQIWVGITGASTRNHPAPYPLQLAERLVRMFSFAGDTVLDPFMGTGTTNLAAAKWGRNSIGYEIDGEYYQQAVTRLHAETINMFGETVIEQVNQRAVIR